MKKKNCINTTDLESSLLGKEVFKKIIIVKASAFFIIIID